MLTITLIIHIDDFCMSEGDTLEFKGGGHRLRNGPRTDFYPNFGPYHQLQKIAEAMTSGNSNDEMIRHFTATKTLR